MSEFGNGSNNRIMESLGYALYLHCQELKRPKRCRRLMRVASTKLQLTNELIWQQRQLLLPSYQERIALDREREYRDILKHNMQQQQLKQQQQKQQKLQHATRSKLKQYPVKID